MGANMQGILQNMNFLLWEYLVIIEDKQPHELLEEVVQYPHMTPQPSLFV
jgi:hypothetical protein